MLRIFSLSALCFSTLLAFGQTATPATVDPLKQGDALVTQAAAAYKAKHYRESADLYARAVPLVAERHRAGVEYSLACSQALAGDAAAALDALEHASQDGYTDRKHAEVDTDLVSLHADPRWQPLLEQITREDMRWGDAAFVTPNAANISNADKLAGLSELWAQAKYGFANFWHVPTLNWDQSYRDYIPKVLATHSTEDYYRVLEVFYAQLQDGHTGVYSPDMMAGKFNRLPLSTRLVGGHVLVIGVAAPPADVQGIQPGDEIVTINSEPATTWAQENVAPYVGTSTQQDKDERVYEYNLLLAPIGTTFTLGIQTPSGKQSTHIFKVEEIKASTTTTATPARSSYFFDLKFLPGNIAEVSLKSFEDNTAADEWDKHWPEISKASSIILDLRANGGGNGGVGYHILSTLIDKPTPTELDQSTRWIASVRARGNGETPFTPPVDTIDPDAARHFSGHVVMLTSPRTFSAAEDMAVAYSQAHIGKIIGEPTGGSTGAPLSFKLPGGGFARVCTVHDSLADGREFVGVGIQPDILVHRTREDIIAGRDPVLEKAIQSLQSNP
jgi:carboxyl-terminal processing protease